MSEHRTARSCPACGGKMKSSLGRHHYVESGLESVFLEHIPLWRCRACAYEEVDIPAIGSLHEMLCKILVDTPRNLAGAEIRFIRTSLGMTAEKFAKTLKVSKITVSRWENGHNRMNRAAAFLLHALVHEHFDREKKKYLTMIEDTSLTDAQATERIEKDMRSPKQDSRFLRFPISFANRGAKVALELEPA